MQWNIVLARPSLSIHEALGNLSVMSHLLLFLYDNMKLPSVLYRDLQSTVQNAYFVAAKYKVHCPDQPLSYTKLAAISLSSCSLQFEPKTMAEAVMFIN